jgi:hypothetical protein
LAPKSCSYSFIWRHPLADPIRFSNPIRLLCENLSFVLKIHNRETSKKEIFCKVLTFEQSKQSGKIMDKL